MWMDAIPLLHVTALAIPAGATIVGYMLCMAMSNSRSILKTSILNLCFFVPMILIGRHWGLVGLAVCWSLSRYLIACSPLWAVCERIATGIWVVWKELAALIAAALIASLAMYAIVAMFPGAKSLPRFILSGGVGTIVYAVVVWFIQRDAVLYAWSMATGRTAESAPAAPLTEPAATQPADSPAFLLPASGTQPDVPTAATLSPATDAPASQATQSPPLNVWLVCTGVGIMNRGIESFFRECFDGLHPHAAANNVRLRLIKGSGPETQDEHRAWCLPRTSKLATFLGKITHRNGYVIEQISSIWPIEQFIRQERPDVILYSDINLIMRLEAPSQEAWRALQIDLFQRRPNAPALSPMRSHSTGRPALHAGSNGRRRIPRPPYSGPLWLLRPSRRR